MKKEALSQISSKIFKLGDLLINEYLSGPLAVLLLADFFIEKKLLPAMSNDQ